ncbi:MAG: hydantoinase/oxoprolinase family protein, partial [Desulfovibrio sp.]
EILALDAAELDQAANACRDMGIQAYAVATKFSTRNPAQENQILDRIQDQAAVATLGHRLSGLLNFPRRVATVYYNSAVWRIYNGFADAVEDAARELGLTAPVYVLKADGGTMPLLLSREQPVESILSGPAASVMGMIALCDISEDCIILDIGGTTTDIAVFAEGSPVIKMEGISVGSYKTLVRALATRSIGIGGDSLLRIVGGEVRVGPEREGPAMAFGGNKPTLLDALNVQGVTKAGDTSASARGIQGLAKLWDQLPQPVAEQAVERAVTAIRDAAEDMVWHLNQRPVYTIGELLRDEKLAPSRVYVMGGPAKAFRKLLGQAFDRDVKVPDDFAVANAVGAALTRPTWSAELFADTVQGRMLVPNLGVSREIGPGYSLAEARSDASEALVAHLAQVGVESAAVDVTEAMAFAMVDDYGMSGKNIRVACQVRPGVDKP